MIREIRFKESRIKYYVEGNGHPIIFIHGYMSSSKIWDKPIAYLQYQYKVICIDLPGHGKSGNLTIEPTFQLFTDVIAEVVKKENISNPIIIGHSFGGYIALDIISKITFPLAGAILFHAHPFGDDKKRSEYREKEANIIRSGRKDVLICLNIHNSFYSLNHEKHKKDIELVTEIALSTSNEACLFALEAMKGRDNTIEALQSSNVPLQLYYGKYDPFLPPSLIDSLKLPVQSKILLQNSAHYGFLEEEEYCIVNILQFLEAHTKG